jgi:hypothetical protein
MQLWTDGSNRMTIDTSGNVGIGLTPSVWSTGKAVELGFQGNALWGNAADEVIVSQNAYYNSGWKYATTRKATHYSQYDAQHRWFTAPSGTANNAISWTQAMTLDASGNLLVGTTTSVSTSSSQTGAEIRSNGISVSAVNSNPCTIANRIGTDGEIAAFRKDGTTVGSIASVATGKIGFYGSGGTGAVIDSSGNVGIGTSSPQYLGHFVDGDVAIVDTDATNNAEKQSLLFGGASGGSAGLAGITGYRGASASAGELIFKTNQGSGITEAMRIDSSGNLLVATTDPDVSFSTSVGSSLQSNGQTHHSSSGTALVLNRTASDGTIAQFRKAGTTVGSIGTNSGYLYIGSEYSTDSHIAFLGSEIAPVTSTGGSRDAAINVGAATRRFKDAYFSGTVNAANFSETVYALSGTALDPGNGGIQYKTLAANTTFTDSLADGESMTLRLEGGATYTVTWPTMTWITSGGNVAPTLNGTKDTLVFWKESSVLYGAYVGYGA